MERTDVIHREPGSYKIEPPPPQENPCQVPWGCTRKELCSNKDCHYGQLNTEK